VFYGRVGIPETIELYAGFNANDVVTLKFDQSSRLLAFTATRNSPYINYRNIPFINQRQTSQVREMEVCPLEDFNFDIKPDYYLDYGNVLNKLEL
jgi:hypothetical protein